jgi:hypothetical protein
MAEAWVVFYLAEVLRRFGPTTGPTRRPTLLLRNRLHLANNGWGLEIGQKW